MKIEKIIGLIFLRGCALSVVDWLTIVWREVATVLFGNILGLVTNEALIPCPPPFGSSPHPDFRVDQRWKKW